MTESITISKQVPSTQSKDYHYLRNAGVAYLENIAGKLWTDYNTHDPGVTILEALCYAITDLGLRTGIDIGDILAHEKDNLLEMHRQFHSAIKILPMCPLTVMDYRKLIIGNVQGVRNAWLYPVTETHKIDLTANELISKAESANPERREHTIEEIQLQGLYNIRLELAEDLESPLEQEQVIAEVESLYHRYRNLCEDLNDIQVIAQEKVKVCMDIDVEEDADIETVYAKILIEIEDYLNPPIQFYSLEELLEKGKTPEEIFSGPVLLEQDGSPIPQVQSRDRGFIDTEELAAADLRKEIRTSDLIRVIMSVEGVRAVKKILLNFCPKSKELKHGEKWNLKISEGLQPVLCTESSLFNFYKGLLPFRIDKEEAQNIYATLRKPSPEDLSLTKEDLEMPLGTFRDLATYTSIQHDFPLVYGVGNEGLPDTATDARKAQAKQLKAYLCFFEQILANYLSQLANIKKIFLADKDIKQTYFSQAIRGVKGLGELFVDFEGLPQILEALAEDEPSMWKRKNRVLDHLLARFAERFSDYVVLMHDIYGRRRSDARIAEDKIRFIQNYPKLSCERAKGFDYFNKDAPLWDTGNISGFQYRLGHLVGMYETNRRNLTNIHNELYEEEDKDFFSDNRFRIIDVGSDKILLSGSTKYENKEGAVKEMRKAVELGMLESFYQKKETKDGRFYFNIVDETGEVIARRIEYFETIEEREEAINYLIAFLNERYSDEGMFVIEQLLLRPRNINDPFLPVCTDTDGCTTCGQDPYSFRVHIVLPAYALRFSNMDFREFVERMIRLELPAHIFPKICWVDKVQMAEFEPIYLAALGSLRQHKNDRYRGEGDPNESLPPLFDMLEKLHSVYPQGTLHDCEDGNDENPIILGRTQIGDM